MDYCKYENTFNDLEDCYEDIFDEPESKTEKKYRLKLIELCKQIYYDFENEDLEGGGDWDGIDVSKEDAKKYVREYRP